MVRPRHKAALGFRLPGKIVVRLVDVGDSSAAAQPLARIDDTDALLDLAVAQAEATATGTDLARTVAKAPWARDLFARGDIAQAALDCATTTQAGTRSKPDRSTCVAALAENRLT